MKLLRVLSLLLLSVTVGAFANQDPATPPRQVYANEQARVAALADLVVQNGLDVSDSRSDLIEGRQRLALSRGVWDDRDVASFRLAHGSDPLVLPLTRLLPKPEINADLEEMSAEPPAWDREDSLDIYYLYVLLPEPPAERERLLQQLAGLLADPFQDGLEHSSFQRLPPPLVDTWKVRLELSDAQFPGGYR